MGFGDKSKKEKAAEAAAVKDNASKKAAEDASWQESDKGAKKKLDRAAAAADKEEEAARKRAEKKALEEADEAMLNGVAEKAAAKKKGAQPAGKLTQAQIQRNMAIMAAANLNVSGEMSTMFFSFIDKHLSIYRNPLPLRKNPPRPRRPRLSRLPRSLPIPTDRMVALRRRVLMRPSRRWRRCTSEGAAVATVKRRNSPTKCSKKP